MNKIKQEEEEVVQSTLEKLFTDGVVIDLDVQFWRATRKNSLEDLGLKAADLPEFVVGVGTKRLLPKADIAQWSRLSDNARYALERRSHYFPLVKGRFVTAANLPALEKELEEIKKDFDSAVSDFLRNYEKRRREWLERFPEHRRRLERQYPPSYTLADKFAFRWTLYSLTVPKAVKKAKFDREVAKEYRERLESAVDEFVQQVTSELREKTVKLCDSISGKIARGEILTEGSLGRIKRFVDQFKAMNFVGDAEVERQLEALKGQTLGNRTAKEFQSDETALRELAGALEATKKLADQITDLDSVTGKYTRRIKV